MEYHIENLQITDLDEVINHERTLFPIPFNKDDYEYELCHNPYAIYQKLVINQQLVGWGGIHCVFDESHLITLAIVEAFQHQGYGKILLQHLITIAQKNCTCMFLEVSENNIVARRLYESFGFKFNRLRKNYYMSENGIEMKVNWSTEICHK